MANAPGLAAAAAKGLCPRCGAQTLFVGAVKFAPSCRACALDFSQFNVGDGPAAFLTLGVGAVVTVLAVMFELLAEPPVWLHFLIWPIVTLALVLGSLRVVKAWLIAVEYRTSAREGRISAR